MSLQLNDDYEEPAPPRHSELTLSPAGILGLVFALLLLCALFFGLGYSMHRSRPVPPPASTKAQPAAPTADFSNFKPAAGSPLHPTPPASSNPSPSNPALSNPAPSHAPALVPIAAKTLPAPVVDPTSSGFYVQIAAVSRQQDAEKLVETFHAEGYAIAARTEPQDKLFHVQIGPYATRRDADLVRQKLAGAGYNPIIK